MNCCDLFSTVKPWSSHRAACDDIYLEFFAQGDLESSITGKVSNDLTDRSKMHCIPEMQVEFFTNIVVPGMVWG